MPDDASFEGVEPLGKRTPYVESLSGYLQRVANVYAIQPADLLEMYVLPVLREQGLWKSRLGDVLRRHAYAMNGAGQIARISVGRMSALTARDDLSECSFLTVADLELIHSNDLVAERKRWCSRCWRADGEPGLRYERKLWALSVVEACPVHDVALTQRCFACGRRQPVVVRDVAVGVCGHCGADLGEAGAPELPRAADETGRQSWYAREAASLVHAVNVSRLMGFDPHSLAAARATGLADLLERSDSVHGHPAAVEQVDRWQREWRRPHLETMFSVLWRARWPVARLFPEAVQRVVAAPLGSGARGQLLREGDGAERRRVVRHPRVHGVSPPSQRALGRTVERGVELFLDLVHRANQGEAMGVSYKGFVEHVHGQDFAELKGRPWALADVGGALRLADRVTDAAGGRRRVTRAGTSIDAAMDTFIWKAAPPHERPLAVWDGDLPYSRQDWLAVFPDGDRRLLDLEA